MIDSIMSDILSSNEAPNRHRFLPLRRLVATRPRKHRPIAVEALRAIRAGHLVKLHVEALGFTQPCAEHVWARVLGTSGKLRLRGVVEGRLSRTHYHGLQEGMTVEFARTDIIDAQLTPDLLGKLSA